MAGRAARVAGANRADIRLKVEEESPRIPSQAKGKERQRDGEEAVADQADRQQTSNSGEFPPPPPLSVEERLAVARGSLALTALTEVRTKGIWDFALEVHPARPVAHPLSAEEEDE
ncbi:hypothetical protein C8R45DRAFT_1115143 [Mycena sanguinolenta]|nr:hypothetical protein C8R45DRAFT_1115143 [Mycena sanguinolenta]